MGNNLCTEAMRTITTILTIFISVSLYSQSSTLLNGLVFYHNCDQTTGSITDQAGTFTRTVTGATINQTGKLGRAISFDRSDDYLDAGNLSALNFNTSNLTFSAWIYITGYPDGEGYNNYTVIGAEQQGASFQINNLGRLQITKFYNNSATQSTNTVPTNQWVHVLCTYDQTANSVSYYINGVLSNTVSWDREFSSPSRYIGIDYSTYYQDDFGGLIDEVAAWNRVLTGSEIAELYNSGNGITHPFTHPTTVIAKRRIIYFNYVTGSYQSSGTDPEPEPENNNEYEPVLGAYTEYDSWDFENEDLGAYTNEEITADFAPLDYNKNHNIRVQSANIINATRNGQTTKALQLVAEADYLSTGPDWAFILDQKYTEVYASYDFYLDPEFNSTTGFKIPGFAARPSINPIGGTLPAGSGILAAMMAKQAFGPMEYAYDFTQYWVPNGFPDPYPNYQRDTILLIPGCWHNILNRVKKNTFTGSTPNADGIWELWIDGKLLISLNNKKFFDQDTDRGFDVFRLWMFHGGACSDDAVDVDYSCYDPTNDYTPDHQCYALLDNLKICIPADDSISGSETHKWTSIQPTPTIITNRSVHYDQLITTEGTLTDIARGGSTNPTYYLPSTNQTFLIDAGEGNTVTFNGTYSIGSHDYLIIRDGNQTTSKIILMKDGSGSFNITSTNRYLFVSQIADPAYESTGFTGTVIFNKPIIPGSITYPTPFGTSAHSFFISETGSDLNNGTTSVLPWKTLNHAFDAGLTSDDTLYVMTDLHSASVTKSGLSGTNGHNIVIQAWGKQRGIFGSKIITGTWTQNTSNKWTVTDASIPALTSVRTTLSSVYIDSVHYDVGRSPDANDTPHWWTSSTEGTTITDNSLNLISNAYAGGRIGGRYVSYSWANALVNSNTSTTFSLASGLDFYSANLMRFVAFNSTGTLDNYGEFFSPVAGGSITVYSTDNLNTKVVEVPIIDYVLRLTDCDYLKFNGIKIGRCNINGIMFNSCDNVYFENSVIEGAGGIGLASENSSSVTMDQSIVRHCNRIGYYNENSKYNITNTLFTEINYGNAWSEIEDGTREAASGSSAFSSCFADGGSYIRYCKFKKTALAIQTHWSYGDIDIDHTLFDSIGYWYGDMGGIYEGGEVDDDAKKIFKNLIFHHIWYDILPNVTRQEGFPHGIYVDYNNHNTNIDSCTFNGVTGAIVINDANYNDTITNCIIAEAAQGNPSADWNMDLMINDEMYGEQHPSYGLSINNNIFVSTNPTTRLCSQEFGILLARDVINVPTTTIDYNKYFDPWNSSGFSVARREHYYYTNNDIYTTLSSFNTASGYEAHGSYNTTKYSTYKVFSNASKSSHTFSLGNCTFVDTEGNTVTGSVSVPSYYSKVLFYVSGTLSTVDEELYDSF